MHFTAPIRTVGKFSVALCASYSLWNVMSSQPMKKSLHMELAEKKPAASALSSNQWPEKWPFTKDDFSRADDRNDADFYSQPRIVTHIDDYAIDSLRNFYATQPAFNKNPAETALLDVASSWISHYPTTFDGSSSGARVCGLGMNEYELSQNSQLTEFVVKDLNQEPILPYKDHSFDAVTVAVSIDYLTNPLSVLKEINRVLRVGGTAYFSFSNRCFPTKVIKMWLETNDSGRIWIVGSYFHFAGNFTPPVVKDISKYPGRSDPMYVVFASKVGSGRPGL